MCCGACRVVRQSFGVMRMNERKWEAAYDEFYAAFKSYQVRGRCSHAGVFPLAHALLCACGRGGMTHTGGGQPGGEDVPQIPGPSQHSVQLHH